MNQYQLIGLVILGMLLVLAGLTFWPIRGTAPEEVVSVPIADGDKVPVQTAPKATTLPGAEAPRRTFENGFYVNTILLTDSGFSPAITEIKKGEEVRFVNRAENTVMHIVADDVTSSLYYRYINQSKTVGRGGEYQLGLPELGIFNYYNLNSKTKGQIVVK